MKQDLFCEQFLATLISVISLKQSTDTVFRCIQVLLNFLRNDPNVFRKFKPSRPLMTKMDLDYYLISYTPAEAIHDKSLELYSFLLRYHREIDQTDCSQDPLVLKKLKRYEEIKSWNELEELAIQIEELGKKDSSGNRL